MMDFGLTGLRRLDTRSRSDRISKANAEPRGRSVKRHFVCFSEDVSNLDITHQSPRVWKSESDYVRWLYR